MKKIISVCACLALVANLFAQNKPANSKAITPIAEQNKAINGAKPATSVITSVNTISPGNLTLAGNPSLLSVAPASMHIFPKWDAGDRDFGFANSVYVTSTVTIYISSGGAQLIAKIKATFEEASTSRNNATNRTVASIDEERVIAYAPTTRIFSKIIGNVTSAIPDRYWDDAWGRKNVKPKMEIGPVLNFGVNTQTDGNDVGNNTSDDCFLDIDFKNIQVETMDLTAGTKEFELPLNLITDALRRTLMGTSARINNLGPCGNGTCFKDNDCFIKFPDAIMRDSLKFPIANIYSNARQYYFNDINLERVLCRSEGNYIKIELVFESNDAELIGKCANDLGSYDAGCIIGTPSAQLNNLKITLALRLIAKEGQLTYEPLDIQPEISSNFSVDCGILDWLCGEVFKDTYQSSIYNLTTHQIRNTLADPFNSTRVGQALTSNILSTINALRPRETAATMVTDVSMQERKILIRYK